MIVLGKDLKHQVCRKQRQFVAGQIFSNHKPECAALLFYLLSTNKSLTMINVQFSDNIIHIIHN